MGYNYREILDSRRRKRVFLTAQDFLNACADYFEWCQDHPLKEEELFHNKGAIVRADKYKVRPFTKRGLCNYLGVPESRLKSYASRGEDWEEAVEMIDQVIYTQKFENAAAGLMNATMISRDLGLAEKSEVTAGVTVTISGEDAEL